MQAIGFFMLGLITLSVSAFVIETMDIFVGPNGETGYCPDPASRLWMLGELLSSPACAAVTLKDACWGRSMLPRRRER